MQFASTDHFRTLAKKRIPHFLFEYIDGGSYDQITLERNRSDLQDISLRQRVMKDVSSVDTSAELFGETYSLPLALAPVGLAGMYAKRGETQAVRAANTKNIPFSLSTVGICSIEEVGKAATAPFWFQLYMVRDRGFMKDLLERAAEQGCTTLLFTVDLPTPGARYRDYHSGLSGGSPTLNSLQRLYQIMKRPNWAIDVGLQGGPHILGNLTSVLGKDSGLNDFQAWVASNFDPSINWEALDFVRENWKGKIVLKGVLDADDARTAVSAGVDGVVVSNHGGRQLDGALSSAKALPDIVNAIQGRMTVLADSGVRTGLDIARMIALGADGVLIGRAWAYALAAKGQAGVEELIAKLESELRVAMMLTGVTNLKELDRSALA